MFLCNWDESDAKVCTYVCMHRFLIAPILCTYVTLHRKTYVITYVGTDVDACSYSLVAVIGTVQKSQMSVLTSRCAPVVCRPPTASSP